jgi:parallel beta-helix repeat protein
MLPIPLLALLAVHEPEPLVLRAAPAMPDSLATALERARQVRAEHPDIHVVIELDDGRFELAGPLVLGPESSNLTLRPAPGAHPVLSAGQRLTGWRADPDAPPGTPARWSAPLPADAGNFQQLFINGVRAQRARTPNDGYFHAAAPLGNASPITLTFRPGDIKPEWAGTGGARLVMLQKWTDLHLPILAVDPATNTAMLPGGPRPPWMDEPDARYWVENAPDCLDAPGEWYADLTTRTITLIPPPGVEPDNARIVAPAFAEVLRIEGTPDDPVRNLRITGVTLSDTDYDMPDEGLMSPQAAVVVRGAVRVTHAVGLVIEDCTLRNLGGYAIDLGRGVQDARIVGNTVTSIGAGGVRIGEPDDRQPAPADECRGNIIGDNEITALGRIFAPACGVIVFQSHHNRITHNHIADLYYTAISVGWTWGYTPSPCHHNTIEYNLVENVGQQRLSDMGGVYTLGPQEGTVVRNNVFRDVHSYRYGGWGLYTDEGSTGILLENNIATRCTDAGFHQHYGRDNVVRNNILAFNERHAAMRTRDEEHRSFEFTRNIIVQDSGSLLGSNWNGGADRFVSDANLWFDTRLGADMARYDFSGLTWDAWRAGGHDASSLIADPLFIDPARPELGVRPESPALPLGFQPIDAASIGPRPRSARE